MKEEFEKGIERSVKNFPGATIDDMYDCIKPLLKKCHDNIILRVGTNNTVMSHPKWCLINCLT